MTTAATSGPNPILGIIPARMASQRFPGKPLVLIGGVPMVISVYREVAKALEHAIIATCDDEIVREAERFGVPWVLTGNHHESGTSRCQEAALLHTARTGISFGAVLNIQGDEPAIRPDMIRLLAEDIQVPGTDIATLASIETDPDGFENPNRVKVVTGRNGHALYFSRSPIPGRRMNAPAPLQWLAHIGIYAYRTEVLNSIVRLEPSPLEMDESLEQLRWLENGLKIHCREILYKGFGIDTPEDLDRYNQEKAF